MIKIDLCKRKLVDIAVLSLFVVGASQNVAVAQFWPYSECDAPKTAGPFKENPRITDCLLEEENGENIVCRGMCRDTRDPTDSYPDGCSASAYKTTCVPIGASFFRQDRTADCVLSGTRTCDCPIDAGSAWSAWGNTNTTIDVTVCDTVPVT